ncbi:MAG: OmpH family outer membrane protein [Elusimicrobiales bacterium]|nr:OmpH family outer membrane protein [Elusimicrobiales bacterium]
MKKLFFIVLLALPAPKAGALELLLEENRGESGTIGYVDIDRVFKEYSGTTGAREEFIAEIKKKEDALNAKKIPIFTLKAEIAKLRQEREFALTLPSLLETQRSVADAAAATAAQAAAQAAQAAALAVQASTEAVQVSTGSPQTSSGTVQAPEAAPQPAPQAAPQPAMALLPGMDGIDMPGITKVPVSHFKFSVSTSVAEIDAVLAKKQAELSSKEEELRLFQRQTEKELLEQESRRSEMLLGRIYVALKELAIKEEVSVIIDKRNILFGQKAVDLTAKLLKKLEENGL